MAVGLGRILAVLGGMGLTLAHPLIIIWYMGGDWDAPEVDASFWLWDVALGLALAAANAVVGFQQGLRRRSAVPAILWLCCLPPVVALMADPIVGILGLYVFLAGRWGETLGKWCERLSRGTPATTPQPVDSEVAA